MTSTRQLKFSRLIQKELADIFQKDQKSFFTGNIISVTHVEVSPDFSVANIFLSVILEKDKDQLLSAVNHHKGAIKKNLSKRIGKHTRRIPDLIFNLDQGAEHAQKMENLFKNLNIPPEEEN